MQAHGLILNQSGRDILALSANWVMDDLLAIPTNQAPIKSPPAHLPSPLRTSLLHSIKRGRQQACSSAPLHFLRLLQPRRNTCSINSADCYGLHTISIGSARHLSGAVNCWW